MKVYNILSKKSANCRNTAINNSLMTISDGRNMTKKHEIIQRIKSPLFHFPILQMRTLDCTSTIKAAVAEKIKGKKLILKEENTYTGKGTNGGGNHATVESSLQSIASQQESLYKKLRTGYESKFVGIKELQPASVSWSWGNCAEPHSLLDAINKIPTYKSDKVITSIEISSATDRGMSTTEPRCGWCKQWAPDEDIPTAKLPTKK